MVKFSQIRSILSVAEFGSLRAAGRNMGIAQPIMTRSIRDVENELGVVLFERHAKGARLTPMGEVFVRRAKTIKAELDRVHEEIAQLKGSTAGRVAVGFSTAASIALLPKSLSAFCKAYPDGQLEVFECLFPAAEARVIDGSIDFYVGPMDLKSIKTPLSVQKLFDNKRYVVCRKGHKLLNAKSLADVSDAQWVNPTSPAYVSDAGLVSWFRASGLPAPHITMQSHSALTTLMTIVSTEMLTIIPRQWLEHAVIKDQIDVIRGLEVPSAMPMCIARRSEMPLTPMAEYFYDQIHKFAMNYGEA